MLLDQEDGSGKIVSDKSKVIITNLNYKKRPISAVADNIEVRNAKKITVKFKKILNLVCYMIKILVYKKKLKLEQLRKETN